MIRATHAMVLLCLVASLCTGAVESMQESAGWPDWDIVVVAHRGLSPGYPENTLSAFRRAIELGANVIEVDLQATKDGVIVLLHDDTVDRTTNGQGFVSDYTFAELRQLDAGSYAGSEFVGEPIPTLEEALDLVIPLGRQLLLDVKDSNALDCKAVVRLVEQHDAVLDVIVGARSVEDVRLFRSLNPNIRLLGFIPGATDIDEFVAAGADIIRLWPRWIRMYPFVDKAHELGKPVWVTSEMAGREELAELIQLGVNGFLTDLPAVLLALLDEIRTQ